MGDGETTRDKSSEGQFTEEEKKHVRSRLASANIPAIVYDKGIGAFSPQSDRVADYLKSGVYKEDLSENRGLYLWGNHPRRPDIFASVAKILVMNNYPAYYVNLHNLVGFLEHDAERKNHLNRIKHLFIEGIQRRYHHEPDVCPYSRYIMSEVEELLEYRRTHGHITHISSALELDKLTWLCKDSVELTRGVLTPISV